MICYSCEVGAHDCNREDHDCECDRCYEEATGLCAKCGFQRGEFHEYYCGWDAAWHGLTGE